MLPEAIISHNPEQLATVLIARLQAEWRMRGLVPLEIVVPNHETARWLTLRIADTLGICTLVRFAYPGRFFQEKLREIPGMASDTPASQDLHAWILRIRNQLGKSANDLPGITPETNRMPIAAEWASALETCARHRVEWWRNWRQFETPEALRSFHPRIWDFLFATESEPPTNLYFDWVAQMKKTALPQNRDSKAPAIHFFGFWTMAPIEMSILRALATQTPVHIYAVLPTSAYLQDVDRSVFPKGDASDSPSLENPASISSLYSIHAELGSLAREMQALLIEHTDWNTTDDLNPHDPSSLLGRLQVAIHQPELLEESDGNPPHMDASIGVHSCNSRRRELEVLKALIQQRLESNPRLSLEDIRVYSPDPDAYAGHLRMVFGLPDQPDAIPIRIQHPDGDEPEGAARAVQDFLSIIPSEWRLQEWQNLLESPSVMTGLGWDAPMAQTAFHWLRTAGTRAGLHAEHLERIDPSRDPAFTAHAAIRRLLHAWCTHSGPDAPNLLKAPKHMEWSGSGELLEHLIRFVSALQEWNTRLREPRIVSVWIKDVELMVEALFPAYRGSESLQSLRQGLLNLESLTKQNLTDPEITVQEFTWLLGDFLKEHGQTPSSSGRAGIAIAPIRQHILLPCEHLFLIGMEESAFPRNRHLLTSRLLGASTHMLCDPSSRSEDRLWILHSLLHARHSWNAIYIGQSERDMLLRPPAGPIQSIIDYINTQLHAHSDGHQKDRPLLEIIQHPGTAHHPTCFNGKSEFSHYSRIDFETACILQNPPPAPDSLLPPFHGTRAAESIRPTIIGFSDLLSFITHPLRYYCRNTLKLELPGLSGDELEDEASYWGSDGLKDYSIKAIIVDSIKQEAKTVNNRTIKQAQVHSAAFRRVKELHLLPSGSTGTTRFNEFFDEMWIQFGEPLIAGDARWLLGRDLESALVNVGSWTVQAPSLMPHIDKDKRLLLGLPAEQKPQHLLAAWIIALLMRRIPDQEHLRFSLVTRKKTVDLDFPDPKLADHALSQWVGAFVQSPSEPCYVYPKTGLEWIKKKRDNPGLMPESLRSSKEWNGETAQPGEAADPYIRYMTRGRDAFDSLFVRDSERILEPLFMLSEASDPTLPDTSENT